MVLPVFTWGLASCHWHCCACSRACLCSRNTVCNTTQQCAQGNCMGSFANQAVRSCSMHTYGRRLATAFRFSVTSGSGKHEATGGSKQEATANHIGFQPHAFVTSLIQTCTHVQQQQIVHAHAHKCTHTSTHRCTTSPVTNFITPPAHRPSLLSWRSPARTAPMTPTRTRCCSGSSTCWVWSDVLWAVASSEHWLHWG